MLTLKKKPTTQKSTKRKAWLIVALSSSFPTANRLQLSTIHSSYLLKNLWNKCATKINKIWKFAFILQWTVFKEYIKCIKALLLLLLLFINRLSNFLLNSLLLCFTTYLPTSATPASPSPETKGDGKKARHKPQLFLWTARGEKARAAKIKRGSTGGPADIKQVRAHRCGSKWKAIGSSWVWEELRGQWLREVKPWAAVGGQSYGLWCWTVPSFNRASGALWCHTWKTDGANKKNIRSHQAFRKNHLSKFKQLFLSFPPLSTSYVALHD